MALTLALGRLYLDRRLAAWPIRAWVSAVSVGMVGGAPFLDLTYAEDSRAEVDMNVVATDKMRYIELQGTGEGNSFSEEEMTKGHDAS